MSELALHEVSALSVNDAFDLFEPDAGPFFLWVRPRLDEASPHEAVTGTAARDGLAGLWKAVDAGYRISQGYFHLASRASLRRGGRRIALDAPRIEPDALYDGITVYTHEKVKRFGTFLAFVRLGEDVLRSEALSTSKRLDRVLDRLGAAHPDSPVLGVEVRFRVFWHIHM